MVVEKSINSRLNEQPLDSTHLTYEKVVDFFSHSFVSFFRLVAFWSFIFLTFIHIEHAFAFLFFCHCSTLIFFSLCSVFFKGTGSIERTD